MDEDAPDLGSLVKRLKESDELKRRTVDAPGLDPRIARLRSFQSERLSKTYSDLMADPHYRPACLFFLSDIYGPRDFSQRDHDIEQLHGALARVLPAHTLRVLGETIELNRMTAALDDGLARTLFDQLGVKHIDPENYAQAYRICDNYDERLRQIELSVKILREVDEGARIRGVGLGLKLARAPAKSMGWIELYDFVVRGHVAFKQMRDVEKFVTTIRQRETRILDRIFAAAPDPFALSAAG